MTNLHPAAQPRDARTFRLTVVYACALLMVLAGCQPPETLNSKYGSRRGRGRTSVNGTLVLSRMFEQAGCTVSSWSRLSPKLDREDVIVWAPDRFSGPTGRELAYFNGWLSAKNNRTLVIIGRDYDATSDYWQAVQQNPSPEQRIRTGIEAAHAASQQDAERSEQIREPLTCEWYSMEPAHRSGRVSDLRGPWSIGVDVDETTISTQRRLRINGLPEVRTSTWPGPLRDAIQPESESSSGDDTALEGGAVRFARVNPLLWSADGDLLAAEVHRNEWSSTSRLIVICNGSWLMNLPLIQNGHRELAFQLVQACPPASRVCFLECGRREMTISDANADVPLALQMFTVFPLNLMVVHLLAVGIFFCFSVFPIFGRPRRLPQEPVSDFGKHVLAVGEMLERARDTGYAQAKIKQYYDHVTKHPEMPR